MIPKFAHSDKHLLDGRLRLLYNARAYSGERRARVTFLCSR